MPRPPASSVELRQYTLRGGRRDTLIELFEREFIGPQNELGAYVLGSFRDLDDPDRFVWLRGFESMAGRAAALKAFYTGPVWRAHRDAANATMLDSDNVLLLRPIKSGVQPFLVSDARKPFVTATIYHLAGTDPLAFEQFFEASLLPHLERLGAAPTATLVTETGPNNFPRLPVRERDSVFVWLAQWPSPVAADEFAVRLSGVSGWRDDAPEALLPALMRKPERLRLAPVAVR